MNSFDRFLCEETGEVKYFQSTSINSEVRTRVRCVPWPEGAPDPSDVPQAGERVIYDEVVYTVLHGIPELTANLWYTWVVGENGKSRFAEIEALTICTDPEPEPEEERTYTESEIHSAYNRTPAYTSNDLIKDLRNPE